MENPFFIYSFVQGPIIVSKIEHGDYIRMGMIVPIEKEKYPTIELHPNSYVGPEVLGELVSIEDTLKEDERLKNKNLIVRSGNLLYGSSLSVKQEKGKKLSESRHLEYMRVPLSEKTDITITELGQVTEKLRGKKRFAGFETGNSAIISAAIAYNFGSEVPGIEITLLDDIVVGEKFSELPKSELVKIENKDGPDKEVKKAYGLRIEIILPKDGYSIEKVEPIFDRLASQFGVAKLAEIEAKYKEFLDLKEQHRTRTGRKVLKEIDV